MTKTQKFITLPVLGALMLAGGGIAGYVGMASAQTGSMTMAGKEMRRSPHVDGTVTAISGSTITITADANHDGGSYSIDASGATFMKGGSPATIASFTIGEKIWASGTVSGTDVTATMVTDRPVFGPGGPGRHGKGPGVMGEVTAVDGSTITVAGKDGQSYAVNAGSATVQKMVAGSLSDIAVGDTIGVQGTVSGTSVTAATIMDDLPARPAQQ